MRAFLVIFSSLSVILSFAQTNQYGKKIAYRFENNINANLYTRGMGVGYSYGRIKGIYKTNYTNLELTYYRNAKEKRSSSKFSSSPRTFIYGKQYSSYNLKVSKSRSQLLFYKGESKGVRINMVQKLGFNLGILKPYYLNLRTDDFNEYTAMKFEDDNIRFLTPSMIHSGADLGTGILESTINPGGTAEFGLNFDFGEYTDLVRILEVGTTLDVYARDISVMVFGDSSRYFLTLYVRINVGWRSI